MLRKLFNFISLIFSQQELILTLAKREVIATYVGSFLGFIWTFINPIVNISIFWFVFSVGFKVQPMNDVPFAVWLTAGLAPWMIFSEVVASSSTLITDNVHLIKKTLFKSQILPIVRICSSLVTHTVFLIVLIFLIIFVRMPFSLYYLQALYYLFGLCTLALGICWLTSALNVFIRDVSKMVHLILQVGFWATPIFWDIKIMSPRIQKIMEFNPLYYIVRGYRESFIYFKPFWEHGMATLAFWCTVLFMLAFGALVFQKLKPQFADVV